MKTVKDLNLKGERVLLRIDVNSELINGKVQDNPRFKSHSETIKFLLNKRAAVVILAHQSNPGRKDFITLKQHSKILNKYVKVKFVEDIIGKKALREIEKLKFGEALLLENVRFLNDEFKTGKNNFVKTIAPMFDYYVNDAFSVMHRNQASIVSFPKVLPSVIGPNAEDEIKYIEKLKSKIKNAIFILGGNKVEDVAILIQNKKILTSGILSLLALKARGYKLGYGDKQLKKYSSLIKKIKKNLRNMQIPVDLAVKLKGGRKEIDLKELPTSHEILDIGKKTILNYKKEIKKAKTIFIKGAPGDLDQRGFEVGTKELLKAIAKSKAFSVVSGGSIISAIERFKINKNNFSHVSLSGGALVYYLAGRKLPGLEALK